MIGALKAKKTRTGWVALSVCALVLNIVLFSFASASAVGHLIAGAAERSHLAALGLTTSDLQCRSGKVDGNEKKSGGHAHCLLCVVHGCTSALPPSGTTEMRVALSEPDAPAIAFEPDRLSASALRPPVRAPPSLA